MTSEQAAGIALTAVGLGAFGMLLRVRARRAAGKRAGNGGPAGSLSPIKALTSPGGDQVAVVLAGAPFDNPLDRALETGLWWLFWLFPARLCRIEVWVFTIPGGAAGKPASLDRLLERPPATRRLIWRGPGHPRAAMEVELSFTGPLDLSASFRGTSHRIELPA